MTTKTDGESAFPHEQGLLNPGMSLRDYFAAKAMQGWTANPLPNDTPINEVAEWAYRQADAMLKARENKS